MVDQRPASDRRRLVDGDVGRLTGAVYRVGAHIDGGPIPATPIGLQQARRKPVAGAINMQQFSITRRQN